jgi:hypothetical protein
MLGALSLLDIPFTSVGSHTAACGSLGLEFISSSNRIIFLKELRESQGERLSNIDVVIS